MKTTLRHLSLSGGLAILVMLASPCMADAAVLNLNGQDIDAEASGDMVIREGVTMVSEDLLQDEMHLTLDKDGKQFTFSNAYKNFSLEGAVGSDTLLLNGGEKKMSVDAQSIDGKLFVPLRPVIELFGDIGWVGADQTVYARYDYNDQLDIPRVQVSDTPIRYEVPLNSSITAENGETPIRVTDGGTLIEKRDANNNLIAVQIGDKPLIQPQNEGNILRWGSYEVEDDYLYWMEQPDPSREITDDQQWYLYIQERKDGAKPECIDHGSYNEVLSVSPTGGMLNNCDFKNGNIIWLRGEKRTGQFEARLYQHDTGETITLDSLPFDNRIFTSVTMEVALGKEDAFWTRAYFMESMREYGTMKRLHLDTGEVEDFSQGYNLLNPFVAGDHLVIRVKPEGNNFMPDLEKPGTYISGELWVYDLKKDAWAFKVDNDQAMIGEENVISTPVILDDTHITVRTDSTYGYSMPIIDLANGTMHATVDDNNVPLMFLPYGLVDETTTVGDIQSVGKDGSCMATFQTRIDGMITPGYAPVYFEW